MLRRFDIKIAQNAIGVALNDANRIRVDIAAVAFNFTHAVVGEMHQRVDMQLKDEQLELLRETGFSYRNAILVSGQASYVRFVVRDVTSQRIGSVTAAFGECAAP